MVLSPLIHAVTSRLAVKLVLIFLLFGIVSIALTMGFMVYQRSILAGEILKRAREQARYLANNCKYQINDADKTSISSLVLGIKAASGFTAFLVNTEGKILARGDTSYTDSTIALPLHGNVGEPHRLRTERGIPIIRTFAPIEIDILNIQTYSILYAYDDSYKNTPADYFRPVALRYIFPNFSPDSKHILCGLNRMFEQYGFFMSVSIADSSQSLLISGGVSNGFWSRSGKYLVYNYSSAGKNPELCVHDVDTNSIRVITNKGTDGYPNSSFTPDDRHILTGLALGPGAIKLYRIPVEGGKPEQLTFHSGNDWYPKSSHDGKWILYTNMSGFSLGNCMFAYNAKTKKSTRVFSRLRDSHRSGSFSPDGKKICYLRQLTPSSDDSWDVYIAEFPTDESKTPEEQYGKRLTFTSGNKFLYTDRNLSIKMRHFL